MTSKEYIQIRWCIKKLEEIMDAIYKHGNVDYTRIDEEIRKTWEKLCELNEESEIKIMDKDIKFYENIPLSIYDTQELSLNTSQQISFFENPTSASKPLHKTNLYLPRSLPDKQICHVKGLNIYFRDNEGYYYKNDLFKFLSLSYVEFYINNKLYILSGPLVMQKFDHELNKVFIPVDKSIRVNGGDVFQLDFNFKNDLKLSGNIIIICELIGDLFRPIY